MAGDLSRGCRPGHSGIVRPFNAPQSVPPQFARVRVTISRRKHASSAAGPGNWSARNSAAASSLSGLVSTPDVPAGHRGLRRACLDTCEQCAPWSPPAKGSAATDRAGAALRDWPGAAPGPLRHQAAELPFPRGQTVSPGEDRHPVQEAVEIELWGHVQPYPPPSSHRRLMPFQCLPCGPWRSHSESSRHASRLTTRPVQVSGRPPTPVP